MNLSRDLWKYYAVPKAHPLILIVRGRFDPRKNMILTLKKKICGHKGPENAEKMESEYKPIGC